MIDKGKEKLCNNEGSEEDDDHKGYSCSSMTDLFLLLWFICGNVVVYGTPRPNFHNPRSSKYCNKTVYLFAFWLITSAYILVGAFCIYYFLLGCCAAMFSGSDDETG